MGKEVMYPMQKPYSLDYDIKSEKDRLVAVNDILNKLKRPPTASDLESMAFYILCGKDENGLNAV